MAIEKKCKARRMAASLPITGYFVNLLMSKVMQGRERGLSTADCGNMIKT
jgi:hypothetical protein